MKQDKIIGKRLSKVCAMNMYKKLLDHRLFERLPERQQDILTYLADGMTFKEIGNEAGITLQAIMSVRDKAFNNLEFINNNVKNGGLTFVQIYNQITNYKSK